MVSGIVVAALSGAIGGAAGAGLGAAVDKARGGPKLGADGKPKRTWTGTMGVIGGIIGAQLGTHVLTPMTQPSVEAQIASASPAFQVLRDHYPTQFEQIVATVKANPNATSAELHSTVAPMISQLMKAGAPQMSDESARELFGLTVDEADALGRADGQSCVSMLNGTQPRTALSTVLTPELAARDSQISAHVLEQVAVSPASPAKPLDEATKTQLAQAALETLTSDERSNAASVPQNLSEPMTDAQAQAACKFSIAMLRAALAAPTGTLRSLAATK